MNKQTTFARTSHPITSRVAADRAKTVQGESHRMVERILADHDGPMTGQDVVTAGVWLYHWGGSESRLRTALVELEEIGRTRRAGFVRREGDRQKRQLWELSND